VYGADYCLINSVAVELKPGGVAVVQIYFADEYIEQGGAVCMLIRVVVAF